MNIVTARPRLRFRRDCAAGWFSHSDRDVLTGRGWKRRDEKLCPAFILSARLEAAKTARPGALRYRDAILAATPIPA